MVANRERSITRQLRALRIALTNSKTASLSNATSNSIATVKTVKSITILQSNAAMKQQKGSYEVVSKMSVKPKTTSSAPASKTTTPTKSLKKMHRNQRFPRTTTTNEGINTIALRNGITTNLSHQIRAVSSPCLTDAALEQPINYAPKSSNHLTVPTASYSATTSTSSSACDDLALQINGTGNDAIQRMPTSQSVGVLQKFKRTLTNFNKSQPQQLPQQARPTKISTTTAATTTSTQIPEAALPNGQPTLTTELPNSDIVDGTAGKYRFGPLIWRSSKERRKTKYNRRDKCNSGDSGIQIELENDEQFARAIAAAGGGCSRNNKINGIEDSPKLRALRRANSAKATSMTDQTSAALNAKAKILKKMEIYNEREAPASLPTRSISQPNGLETFGINRADLDESDSDSVASHDDGPHNYPIYAEVLYSFTATGPQELGLERGTLIEVLRKEVGPWWFGRFKKDDGRLVDEILDIELGWFPKEFVRIIQYPDTDAFFMQHLAQIQQSAILPTSATRLTTRMPMPTSVPATKSHSAEIIADSANNVDMNNITTIVIESPPYTATANVNVNGGECNALAPSRSLNVIMDGGDILRRSAVKELLDTEANYVKLLASICEGYLPAMSKRIDIFSPNSIRLIFSNITAIYKFQRRFLEALRKGIEQNQVAKVFLKMHKGFLCYSTYCNAYPRALIELETYDRVKDARIILDNCRESENLAELPLSAHLLAPVQRICRYPLHLAEILKTATKHTTEARTYDLGKLEQLDASQLDIHDTKETIDMALEAMKSITEAVNEGKRHSETIARHQASFQNFKGPPLHLHSTRFFLQIDATRQKQNLWNSSCTLFLFDNQLVYCKRDLIKRSQFIYKGRIFLDRCRVVNVRDGKMFGHTIKNSLRIYCESLDKWYDFSFRSANRKHRFLNTLALERQFGGKALYVSEMTGFEYNYEERDYSDQSDYEMPESESGLPSIRVREYIYDVNTIGTTSATSGESSVPESPAKSAPKFSSDTLPKKSTQQRDSNASNEYQTGSLGRRRLGNWFRKPKSSNSTPNHSPTHKPAVTLSQSAELHTATTDTSELNLVLAAEHNTDLSSGSTV
ncbi:uncharacterized protein LOC119672468 isoform X2 [Teleopsis dalmanni]|uniref:uncharacterized protein LOC119672468 isoform X2 n=1 Tax=Teleopsis dalmanni TaxID=139649 RepID=UPI0018CD4A18|nr:uncharacterized protein LOC119672468 isoform X2 [Teleopsis dalmanni]